MIMCIKNGEIVHIDAKHKGGWLIGFLAKRVATHERRVVQEVAVLQ